MADILTKEPGVDLHKDQLKILSMNETLPETAVFQPFQGIGSPGVSADRTGQHIFRQAAQPTASEGAREGDLWFDTDDNNKPYKLVNGVWTSVQDTSAPTTPGILGWAQDFTWTKTDADTLSWSAGTITTSDGTSYSIGSGNTGNISAVTYIYLDTDVSTTALQTTTTASSAVGSNKILVAVAKNNSDSAKKVEFQAFGGEGQGTFVTADEIAADTITANEIAANTITAAEIAAATITATEMNVSQLSAIAADLGTITAGSININSGAASIDSSGNAIFKSVTLQDSVTITDLQTGSILTIQGWTYDGAFTVTDADTVAWAGGTLTMGSGETFTITGSNTGNMVAKTYIYFDEAASTTAFQTTTTRATAFGLNKLLIAVAENQTNEATFIKFGDDEYNIDGANIMARSVTASEIVANTITANEIAASTITATEMNVSQLSAIAADLGTITAGSISINGGVASIDSAGVAIFSDVKITGLRAASDLDGQYLTADTVTSAKLKAGVQGWTYSGAFSSTDADTVAWAGGTFTLSDGTTYTITGSNTGNMAAETYIYLDIGVSTTAFQTTTTAGSAVGDGKIMVARATPGTNNATFIVFGGTGGVYVGANEIDGEISLTNLAIAAQGWTQNMVFSASDADTVAWGSGTIEIADGTSYSITGGNTGNMAARTYIYFDTDASTTTLQTTTTLATAVGQNKILIASAINGTSTAQFQVFSGSGGVLITGGDIEDDSITATQITANTITASEIAASTITTNEIASNTIVAGNIAAGTITTTEIAANTIVASNIAAATITTTEIAANTIAASNIASNTITATEIAAGTITTTEIASNTIVAGNIAAGTITTSEISIGSFFKMPDDTNLAGYWALDEGSGTSAIDGTKNGNDGTITSATYAAGVSGSALDFDGSSGDVLISDNAAIQNIFDSGGSVSVWINADTSGEGGDGRVLHKEDGTSGWHIRTTDESVGTMKLRFIQRFSTSGGTWETTNRDITANTWHHVAVVYDSDATGNDPTVYVDGTSVAITEVTAPVGTRNSDASQDLYIGNRSADDKTFDGTIDEARLYTASLTAAEVQSLYLNPTGTQGTRITGGQIETDSITATQIAATTITASEIANTTITAGKIVNGTITATQIAGGTITTTEIAANTITASNIASNTITAAEIAASTITATELNVSQLSAIAADLGTVTAGSITTSSITIAGEVVFGSTSVSTVEERANLTYDDYVFQGNYNDGLTESAGTGTITRNILTTTMSGGGNCIMYGGTIGASLDWDNDLELIVVGKWDDTSTCDTYFGFYDQAVGQLSGTAITSRHALFIMQNGSLYASVANDTTQTLSAAISGVTLTNRNAFRIVYTGGTDAKFYVNGTLEKTLSSNLASGGTDPPKLYWEIDSTGGGANAFIFSNNYIFGGKE